MNKFWAMLRDSYKEAVDGSIMLVMFVLLGLVVLLIASLSVTPVPAADAVPRMVSAGGGGPNGLQVVVGDRGRAKRQAFFFFRPDVSNTQVGESPSGHPWDAPVTFTITYTATGQGAAGAEVEVDEKGQPKPNAIKKEALLLGDPFKEAVRYWAAVPGEKKPAFTDALAEEYVTAQVRENSRLNVTKVTKVTKKPAGGGGGVLGGLFGTSAASSYEVTASGGDRLGWSHNPSVLFGLWNPEVSQPLGRLVYLVESTLLNGVGAWVILLAGVVVTAGFIPNMLRKGGIDLLISKPVPRPLILLYKYLGGLLFVFFLTTAAVVSVWVVMGVRTGVWSTALMWCIPGITAYFAILYACSTLVGVLTRNTIVSVVVTIVFWLVIFLIGFLITWTNIINTGMEVAKTQQKQQQAAAQKGKPPVGTAEEEIAPPAEPDKGWWLWSLEALNRAAPRINDLDELTTRQIANDLLGDADRRGVPPRGGLGWAEVAAVSGAWLVLFLGLATLRFVTRSY